ncbi:MAG: selenocysteine-specific translation elongation factor [Bacteroidales bacterium]
MKSIVIGTAGHIDHGKSALVRALTNIDPDRLKEEQERGITIDLGFAHLEAEGIDLAFVDVPGHERFVKNMLAGVGGFDAVLLVIAADESVMPQTREHFEICRLLQIPSGIVVLTKSDLVDADTLELVRLEARDLVAGSFLAQAPVLAVSSRTGEGLDRLREALVSLAREARARPAAGVARLPIDRVFTMKGFGTVITGTLVSGSIRQDDELEVMPVGSRVKVRAVQVHGARQGEAHAGQRVALNLGGVETSDLSRGETLATPGGLAATRTLDALVEVVPTAKALRHGARVRFHQGTSEVLGRVAISEVTGGESGAAEIRPGQRAHVRLRLESPAVVTRGDRYILRAYSPPVTIAGGSVLDPQPPRGGTRTASVRRRFACLSGATGAAPEAIDSVLTLVVEESGAGGFAVEAATSRLGLSPDAAHAAAQSMVKRRAAVQVGNRLFSTTTVDGRSRQVLEMLTDHHRRQPLVEGMPREELRERIFGTAGPGLFEQVLTALAADKKIVARDRVALAGHRLALSDEEARARAANERRYQEGGLKPPESAELIALAGGDARVVERMVALLLRQKTLVKVENLLFHQEALAKLRDEVAALKRERADATLDVAAFKDRYGISRKYAIPLLEYLDRERVTRRVGDVRVVL